MRARGLLIGGKKVESAPTGFARKVWAGVFAGLKATADILVFRVHVHVDPKWIQVADFRLHLAPLKQNQRKPFALSVCVWAAAVYVLLLPSNHAVGSRTICTSAASPT